MAGQSQASLTRGQWLDISILVICLAATITVRSTVGDGWLLLALLALQLLLIIKIFIWLIPGLKQRLHRN